jgi:hypothetical protein
VYSAAKKAGLDRLPVIIKRRLSDEQALELIREMRLHTGGSATPSAGLRLGRKCDPISTDRASAQVRRISNSRGPQHRVSSLLRDAEVSPSAAEFISGGRMSAFGHHTCQRSTESRDS